MRKIAVFTGTRAEYGLLYWILKELQGCSLCSLQLLVGGSHLSVDFGYTVGQIEEDGFTITQRLDFLSAGDSHTAIAQSMGRAIICGAEAFEHHQPDLLVLLGDRYEALAIAQAAMLARIPIAHIHGGELTQGAIDDAIRHAISKLSHIHFAATEGYRQRIIQLGEQPSRVFSFGAPGLESIDKLALLDLPALSESIDFNLTENYFLVTYHPETLAADNGKQAVLALLDALDSFPQFNLLITYPNADSGGKELINLYQQYQQSQPNRVLLVQSLGQVRYLSSMKHCKLVVGNSSSGIIEVPSFHKPTINIGNRQKGRDHAATVLHCEGTKVAIERSISKALSSEFSKICSTANNPYGAGNVALNIVKTLLSVPLDKLIDKHFYDLKDPFGSEQSECEDKH